MTCSTTPSKYTLPEVSSRILNNSLSPFFLLRGEEVSNRSTIFSKYISITDMVTAHSNAVSFSSVLLFATVEKSFVATRGRTGGDGERSKPRKGGGS